MIKKQITAFLMFLMLGVLVPVFSTSALANTATYAQPQVRRHHRRSFYRRHRTLVNVGGGALAGGVVGGLLGGKKGVAIGGLAGAGTGAIVTHRQNRRRYVRRY